MSETAETTAAGATRSLFGSLGFILLMVGVEGMRGQTSLGFFVDAFLVIIGVLCVYAAFFWESAKKSLSEDAQKSIGTFAQHPVVRFGMIALALESLILARFVEEHRWPFSYPADPAMEQENGALKGKIQTLTSQYGPLHESAQKWQFVHEIRTALGNNQCQYSINSTNRTRGVADRWQETIRDADWNGAIQSVPAPDGSIPYGVTLRTSEARGYMCASALQKALTDIYLSAGDVVAKVVSSQITPYLTSCSPNQACVQIDMDW